MSENKKSWFITDVGSAFIYAKPDFNSACVSEIIFGESSKILAEEKNWCNIECEDGYKGWVYSFYGYKSMLKNKPKYKVVYPDKNGRFSHAKPFGSYINDFIPGSIPIKETLDLRKINEITNNLVGIPYRWGGKTSLGFDCSGFVQTVLKIFGFSMPRDSKQQKDYFKDCVIDLKKSSPGDLHFFGTKGKVSHVSLSLGEYDIIHSQGCVKKQSLNKNSKNFNKNLFDIYLSTHSIKCKFQH